jgi:AAA+ superfamily predicted ATPase
LNPSWSTRYLQINVNVPFEEELQVYRDEKIFYLPRVEMTVGLKVSQSRIVIDRSVNYNYAFAVVDCVNDKSFTASKHNKSEFSEWSELKHRSEDDKQEYVKNGSIISVSVAGFFDPKELKGLESVPMKKK